ncbi:hypothetical protein V6N13_126703 [Hibiscus sabdariffa]
MPILCGVPAWGPVDGDPLTGVAEGDWQPVLQQITPGRTVASGYMEWFYANGKPFIMTHEARLEFYECLVQSDPDNNVVLVLPVPLLGVHNKREDRRLPQDQE